MDIDVNSIEQTEILIATGGVITASTLLSLLLQAVKDWYPSISGRSAVASIYGASLVTAIVIIMQIGANLAEWITWVTVLTMTLTLTTTARGIYAAMRRDTETKAARK